MTKKRSLAPQASASAISATRAGCAVEHEEKHYQDSGETRIEAEMRASRARREDIQSAFATAELASEVALGHG